MSLVKLPPRLEGSIERRRRDSVKPGESLQESERYTELPAEYCRTLEATLSEQFALELRSIAEIRSATPRIFVQGRIFSNEMLIWASITFENELSAITFYVSQDWSGEWKATDSTQMKNVIDVLGALMDRHLTAEPENLERLVSASLVAIDEVPILWTVWPSEIPVSVRVDRTHPVLEALTERWLAEHDPEYAGRPSNVQEIH